MNDLDNLRKILPELGQRYEIDYVDVFGSLARGEALKDSDIDLIIEFKEPKQRDISGRFFGFLHSLEDTFGKRVDLLTPRSIRNPILKKTIERDRLRIY